MVIPDIASNNALIGVNPKNKYGIAANKPAKIGTVTTELKTEFAAGSVVNLVNTKAKIYNDKVYIYKCRHDFIRNKTKIFFRYGIEGY